MPLSLQSAEEKSEMDKIAADKEAARKTKQKEAIDLASGRQPMPTVPPCMPESSKSKPKEDKAGADKAGAEVPKPEPAGVEDRGEPEADAIAADLAKDANPPAVPTPEVKADDPPPAPKKRGRGRPRKTTVDKPRPADTDMSTHPLDRALERGGEGHNVTKLAKDMESYIKNIERLESDKKEITTDIAQAYIVAGESGLDVKTLKKVIKERRQNQDERQAQLDLFDVYWDAQKAVA